MRGVTATSHMIRSEFPDAIKFGVRILGDSPGCPSAAILSLLGLDCDGLSWAHLHHPEATALSRSYRHLTEMRTAVKKQPVPITPPEDWLVLVEVGMVHLVV